MLRALTLIQPWAWAVAHAGKAIENRTWPPPKWLVGQRLAIHAGMKWDEDAVAFIEDVSGRAPPAERTHGAIVAIAKVAGVLEDCDVDRGGARRSANLEWFAGPCGWLLEDVVAIEPLPCKGAQGLWPVPDELLPVLRARYAAARRAA